MGPKNEYGFLPMDVATARTIADEWRYPAPYDFYNMAADPEDYDEFVTPKHWPSGCFQVHQVNDLVGFLLAEAKAASVEIGLGLRPDLTGNGIGGEFVKACIERAARSAPDARSVTLSVATFNKRAIAVYLKAGFLPHGTRTQETNGGQYQFLDMALAI